MHISKLVRIKPFYIDKGLAQLGIAAAVGYGYGCAVVGYGGVVYVEYLVGRTVIFGLAAGLIHYFVKRLGEVGGIVGINHFECEVLFTGGSPGYFFVYVVCNSLVACAIVKVDGNRTYGFACIAAEKVRFQPESL